MVSAKLCDDYPSEFYKDHREWITCREKGSEKTRLNHIRHFYVVTVACYNYIPLAT
jgi:hypothetical protein